jgi:hypothetical protein
MSQLIVAIGWFLAFAAATAVVGAIVFQMEPRAVDKAGGTPAPGGHH